MLVKLIEFACLVVLFYFVMFQMLIPVILNRPWFPMFRKQKELEDQLTEANQEVIEKELQDKINQVKGK